MDYSTLASRCAGCPPLDDDALSMFAPAGERKKVSSCVHVYDFILPRRHDDDDNNDDD
jgi:hypothetical protein